MQRLLHGLQPAPVAGIVEDKVPTPFAERSPATNAGLRRRFVLLGFTAVLAACGLPQQGPRSPEILDGADQGQYVLLDVDTAITQRLGRPQRSSLGGFGKAIAARPSQAITIGDTLDIRILEAGGGGLFARAEGSAGGTEFPGIVVDAQGKVSLPYVGTLAVVGLTPGEVETRIVAALEGKAIEPQALVRLAQTDGSSVTVAGDVATPGPFSISLRGSRLSQAISSAGGSRFPAHETVVTVRRDGRSADARLNDILLDPRSDIGLQRDDLVVLTHEPPRYTLTGSVGSPGTYKLENTDYTLLEAVSAAGGPSDSRADASGVFLFRYEPRDRLVSVGKTDLDAYPTTTTGVPTVYRFDMRKPEMQFHARNFYLTDGDAIYISNAGTVQLGKVLGLLGMGLTTANRVDSVSQ